jgi:hypothetical protein
VATQIKNHDLTVLSLQVWFQQQNDFLEWIVGWWRIIKLRLCSNHLAVEG